MATLGGLYVGLLATGILLLGGITTDEARQRLVDWEHDAREVVARTRAQVARLHDAGLKFRQWWGHLSRAWAARTGRDTRSSASPQRGSRLSMPLTTRCNDRRSSTGLLGRQSVVNGRANGVH